MGSEVVITGSAFSNARFMRLQLRRLLTATLQIDYTVTTTGITADALVAFLRSASTVNQLTTALQAAYPGIMISIPTVTIATNTPSSSSSTSPASISSSTSPTGAITGGVIGGLFFLLFLLGGGFYCRRRARKAPREAGFSYRDSLFTFTAVVVPEPPQDSMIDSIPEAPQESVIEISDSFREYNPSFRLNSARNPAVISSTLPSISWDDLSIDETSWYMLGKGSYGLVFRGMLKESKAGQTSGCQAVAIKAMSRARAEAYPEQLIKGREEAVLGHLVSSRGPWLSECMTLVHGFAQGPLPASLTTPFHVSPGEEAFGIVMRLEEGGSLEHHLYKLHTKFPMLEKIRILAGISHGLTALHGIGLVHGDMKPANVLLSGDNPPKIRLSDFGLSSLKVSTSTFSSTLNMTTHKKGTIKYCAPEMLDLEDGSDQVASASRRTDMHAFAITAWEILVGVRPFENVVNQHLLEKDILRGKRPPISRLPVGTPDRIKDMITDCWDKHRHTRWSASACFVSINREFDLQHITEWDIFLSHRWASKPFLSHLYNLLCEEGYTVWYDIHHMGYDLIKSMQQGIEKSTVVLACMDSEYQKRDNCMLELRHAYDVVKLKSGRTECIIGVMMEDGIGWGTDWGTDEVKSILDLKGKMFASLHEINSAAWEDSEGPTEQMLQQLREHEQVKQLFKMLRQQMGK